jgi:hypothetical protein
LINAAALSKGKYIPVLYSEDDETDFGEFVLVQSPEVELVQRFPRGNYPTEFLPLPAETQKKILKDLEEF